MHIVGHATESEVHASGKFCSIYDPLPPPPLSLSLYDQIREKESLPLNSTIRMSKQKFAKYGHKVQVSRAPTAGTQWLIQKKNQCIIIVNCTLTMSLDNVYLLVDDSTFASTNNKYLEDSRSNRRDLQWSAAPALQ